MDAPGRGFRLDDEPSGILTRGLGRGRCSGRRRPRSGPPTPTSTRPSSARTTCGASSPASPTVSRPCASTSGSRSRPASACLGFAALAAQRGATIREGVAARVARAGSTATGVDTADGVVERRGGRRHRRAVVAGGRRPVRRVAPDPAVLGRDRRAGARTAAPRHVLEEADIDAAIEPDGGLADDEDGATGFSLVTADGRTSLGSTFLPFEPDPHEYEARLRARWRPLPAGDRGLADARPAGLRAPARARRPAAGRRRSRGGTACSWPPATGRGGSRPVRHPRATSPRWCWVTRIRGAPRSPRDGCREVRRRRQELRRRRGAASEAQRQLSGSNRKKVVIDHCSRSAASQSWHRRLDQTIDGRVPGVIARPSDAARESRVAQRGIAATRPRSTRPNAS